MDDFTGLLARDFGLKPQGKSAPMAPHRSSPAADFSSFTSSPSFGIGSSSPAGKKSDSLPVFDDHGDDLFNDVFSGPPRYGSSESRSQPAPSAPAFDYDAMFKDQKTSKSAPIPVYDKPVYDEDIFEGIPGLKSTSTSQSARFDDVFSSISSSPKHKKQNSSPFDDLLGNLGRKDTEPKKTESVREGKGSSIFDDLIPGFPSRSSPPIDRSTSETSESQKPSSGTSKTSSPLVEDPFAVLQSASTPPVSSTREFGDPLEEFSKVGSSNSRKTDHSSVHGGVFVDVDPLDSLGKSVPDTNNRDKDHIRTGSMSGAQSPVESSESYSPKKVPVDDFLGPQHTPFTTVPRSSSPANENPNIYQPTSPDYKSPKSDGNFESFDDVWLTVSEIPLFTQPTSAPPPARPPPPRPARPIKKKVNEPSLSSSTHYSHGPGSARASAKSSTTSQINGLEDFASGWNQSGVNGYSEPLSSEDSDLYSTAAASAAAMKEAMDKAEAKFRHARAMREKENLKAGRSREGDQMDNYDFQERELREKQERLDRERVQKEKEMERARELEREREREREEREREQRRLERERIEREREKEEREREQRRLERERIDREREIARQAVERATREARERAAAEARAKAQRAAVQKVATEARERAERAAVQRAQAEARERAAAEAREKAEKAAAEARERANAEAREKEARVRAERAAVERAATEARARAAAEARERAAAQAKAKQQQNDNDLESFFSMGSRPSSAPKQRANTSDPFFDSWNMGGSFEASRTSSGAPSGASANMRKASSATNIVDDLSSIFGAAASQSGEFQEVEGESEERRRARLERHQRTQERAAKALAEKNERDLQAQNEQAERHRIGETLDFEIKRWAAGKEGNLRALLSTLQYVLWPECGWQPVSLTDLITAASVKKVYRKATLCIHPDKVQQKGANLQQKYVAEKVFDLLKEAWNKFNSEELF
ncbi:PREDICTED: auxilin-related protein 2-like [Tarenaya hassleriana]|uniref:auxilin-related protein 2-like n=1 Tax=Tarenaya hassleriana TaxID=28532 RepID=UPI00053C3B1B|nr:PREDICTED: auxilin-related protein 2-like [Tarenaya hassleriana]